MRGHWVNITARPAAARTSSTASPGLVSERCSWETRQLLSQAMRIRATSESRRLRSFSVRKPDLFHLAAIAEAAA